ncbi:YphA family membrane protein [Bacillus solitudinis]|uniref:YphA family membrane protein n=1 Tax=Bacillus solitudinis TaxID=2014074 RepID=UPI000C23D18E|nr:hypothetical protein [Bacillus solitudinis]
MDGVLAYWLGWMAWVMVTFFAKKTRKRVVIAANLLIVLILLSFELTIFGYDVSGSFLFLGVCCCFELGRKKWWSLVYCGVVACIIGSAYASFLLIVIYDPVIELMDTRLMISAIVVLISILTISDWRNRILFSIVGLLQGEWMYAMVVKELFNSTKIGGGYFFDIISVMMMISGSVWCVQMTIRKLANFVQERKKPPIIEAS